MIRSITYTVDIENIFDLTYQKKIKDSLEIIKTEYHEKGFFIRTVRFNIKPIKYIENECDFISRIEFLSQFSAALSVRWFNVCFDFIGLEKYEVDSTVKLIKMLIENYDNVFVNVILSDDRTINNYAVIKTSSLIKEISTLSDNGIDNFRFGASTNVKPNTPFFPFSYSDENDSFSIAVETTSEAIQIIKQRFSGDYIVLKNKLRKGLERRLILIDTIAKEIMLSQNIRYNGQDISLSPFPDEKVSVIEILKVLGVDNFGSNGTQFMTSYLTSILKEIINHSYIKTVGFNGVMYSLLEDHLMCEAHDQESFTIDSIILYSTVCGCGLDMVPLPGNTSADEIASMIFDVATTAIRLNKPLGVRLLPIPNKLTGDRTNLKLDFLYNTRISDVKHLHLNSSLFDLNEFHII